MSGNYVGGEIDGWTVVRLLGHGGAGTVYEARRGQQLAAIKIARTEEDSRRLAREGRHLGKLHDPQVVGLLGHGQVDGRTYLVLELAAGGTLEGFLQQQGRLNAAQAVGVARAVLRGLVAIHERGLAHRDVKLGNILLDGALRPKLGDLGTARAHDGSDRITSSQNTIGTFHYMAPEQWRPRGEEVDPRSDVYALGICLFQLLTEEVPFQGPGMMWLAQQHLDDPLPDLRLQAPDLPNQLVRAIEAFTRKSTKNRPSAERALQLLEGLREEPLQRAPRSLSQSSAMGVVLPSTPQVQALALHDGRWEALRRALAALLFLPCFGTAVYLGGWYTWNIGAELRRIGPESGVGFTLLTSLSTVALGILGFLTAGGLVHGLWRVMGWFRVKTQAAGTHEEARLRARLGFLWYMLWLLPLGGGGAYALVYGAWSLGPRPLIEVSLWAMLAFSALVAARYGLLLVLSLLDVLGERPLPDPGPGQRWPRIAVIMPVYKEKTLSRALESVKQAALSYPGDIHVFVVLDGTDGRLRDESQHSDSAADARRFLVEEGIHYQFWHAEHEEELRRFVADPAHDIRAPEGFRMLPKSLIEEQLESRPEDLFSLLQKRNGGKSSGLNWGIEAARAWRADAVFCMDGDVNLALDTFERMARHLLDPRVTACAGQVQVRNWFGGTEPGENEEFPFWESLQALEYVVGHGVVRRAQGWLGAVSIIPGPCGLFRISELDRVQACLPDRGRDPSRQPEHGPYEEDTLAEDCDLTLNLLDLSWREGGAGIAYEPLGITETDGRGVLKDLIKQRYRWLRGILTATLKAVGRWISPTVPTQARGAGAALAYGLLTLGALGLMGLSQASGLGLAGALPCLAGALGLSVAGVGRATGRSPATMLVLLYMLFEGVLWPVASLLGMLAFLAAAVSEAVDVHGLLAWFAILVLLDVLVSAYSLVVERASLRLLPMAICMRPVYTLALDVCKVGALMDAALGVGAKWQERH